MPLLPLIHSPPNLTVSLLGPSLSWTVLHSHLSEIDLSCWPPKLSWSGKLSHPILLWALRVQSVLWDDIWSCLEGDLEELRQIPAFSPPSRLYLSISMFSLTGIFTTPFKLFSSSWIMYIIPEPQSKKFHPSQVSVIPIKLNQPTRIRNFNTPCLLPTFCMLVYKFEVICFWPHLLLATPTV